LLLCTEYYSTSFSDYSKRPQKYHQALFFNLILPIHSKPQQQWDSPFAKTEVGENLGPLEEPHPRLNNYKLVPSPRLHSNSFLDSEWYP
jgi:hypothetical protein